MDSAPLFEQQAAQTRSNVRARVFRYVALTVGALALFVTVMFAAGNFTIGLQAQQNTDPLFVSDLPKPDQTWSSTVKFNTRNCPSSDVHSVFYYNPEGCTPMDADSSVSKVCDRVTDDLYQTVHDGDQCEGNGETEVISTPSSCQQVNDQLFEEYYCDGTLPDEYDPLITLWDRYMFGAYFSDSRCSVEGHHIASVYHALDACQYDPDTGGSRKYVQAAEFESYQIYSYEGSGCTGTATISDEIHMGACTPVGNFYARYNIIHD